VFPNPERLFGFDATVGTRFARAFRLSLHKVRPFASALVLEHTRGGVLRPRCRVAAVARQFQHFFHVEIFDGHQFVFPSVVVREFVQEVTPLALDVEMMLATF
jgi:hypothetical protein